MTKILNYKASLSSTGVLSLFRTFENLNLGFVSDFEFRASNLTSIDKLPNMKHPGVTALDEAVLENR